ncbi:MAG: TSUP family transporter [Hyphomicrobiaceae bacterium]
MTTSLLAVLAATMVATSFLSGIFGMAGGMILLGVLLALLTLPEAMALHAVTQIASNGWRGVLWVGHVRWRAASWFLLGCAASFAVWSIWRYVPSKPLTLILLGATPFMVRMLPAGRKPDPDRPVHGVLVGAASMILMLLAGVSGPLIDTFFLGGKFERRQIIATKAACQVFCHGAKLAYFGGIVERAGSLDPWLAGLAMVASVTGTSLAKPVLERLSDAQYRRWANHIITTIALAYIAQGLYQLASTASKGMLQ